MTKERDKGMQKRKTQNKSYSRGGAKDGKSHIMRWSGFLRLKERGVERADAIAD